MGRLAHDGAGALDSAHRGRHRRAALCAYCEEVSTRTSRIETKRVTYATEQGYDTRGALFAVAMRFPDGDARGADEKGIRYGRHVL